MTFNTQDHQQKPAGPFMVSGLVGESKRKTGMYSRIPEDFERTFNTQDHQQKRSLLCVMGPTASGKTNLAIQLTQQFPCDIISVDSAMVYRGMNIGTAKPTPQELSIAPHRLIDILEPASPYSAGQFCIDAKSEIEKIFSQNRVPLLVGGTMLYFRSLQFGLSQLPSADEEIRTRLTEEAAAFGWGHLHNRLAEIDPIAARRINPQDTQRIQRALEVHEITGRSLSDFCKDSVPSPLPYRVINIAIVPEDREKLHQRIEQRFLQMLKQGFVEEVEQLRLRGDLNIDMPSMRSVGYHQIWRYLNNELTFQEMQEQAIIATRQLAKRQMTWLRSWPEVVRFDSEDLKKIVAHFEQEGRH